MKLEKSVIFKSLGYAILGIIIVFIPYQRSAIALVCGVALFLWGLLFFEPTPEMKPFTGNIPDVVLSTPKGEMIHNGKSLLMQINRVNAKIMSPKVRDDLSQTLVTADKILDFAGDKEDVFNQIKELVKYYLPAILKTSHQYLEIQDHGIQTSESAEFSTNFEKNIVESKSAFTNLLNSLYKNDISEAAIEMEVLKSSLKTKGLLDDSDFSV